jgi:hypothetical protein
MEATGRTEQQKQHNDDDVERQSQTDSHNESKINSSEKNLLKTLLSTSTGSTKAPTSVEYGSCMDGTTTFKESMITKEVNDTQLNLKKILYEPDKEVKEKEALVLLVQNNNNIESQQDDEDRLIIDISDDERDTAIVEQRKKKFSHRFEKVAPIHLRINQSKCV